MLSYSEFWKILSSAYPISKGNFHLPIATNLLELREIDAKTLFQEVHNIFYQVRDVVEHQTDIKKMNGVIRFDCVLNQKWEIKVLEVNAVNPDGLLMHDYTYGILKNGKPVDIHLQQYLEFFDREKQICILYPDISFIDAFFLEKELLENKGYNVSIGTRNDLIIKDNNLYSSDEKKIDTIRSCMDLWRYSVEQISLIRDLKIRMINSMELRKIGNKSLLKDIHSTIVPQTKELSLITIQEAIKDKDHRIIKPVSGSEGFWVYIGIDYTQSERESILESNIHDNYILQEYISIQKITTPFYENEQIIDKTVYFDICPHIFVKEWEIFWNGLILTRFSENKILNVAQWWGIWYMKVD